MAQTDDSPVRVIRETAFAAARTFADPATKSVSGPLRTALKNHKKALADRNDADDGTLDAAALFDAALQAVEESYVNLYRDFVAQYHGEKHAHVTFVFPRPAKTIVSATGKETALKVYGLALKQARNKKIASELKSKVAAFGALVTELEAAAKAVTAAEDLYAEAVDVEVAARAASVVALRKARAQITDKFPDNLSRVARYFLKSARKKEPTLKELEKQLAELQKTIAEVQAKVAALKAAQKTGAGSTPSGGGGPAPIPEE